MYLFLLHLHESITMWYLKHSMSVRAIHQQNQANPFWDHPKYHTIRVPRMDHQKFSEQTTIFEVIQVSEPGKGGTIAGSSTWSVQLSPNSPLAPILGDRIDCGWTRGRLRCFYSLWEISILDWGLVKMITGMQLLLYWIE